jgi:HK97 gp10 family phage protein
MKVTFKVEGLAQCEEALAALPAATTKNVLKRALMKAAEPVVTTAAAIVRKRTGRLGKSVTVSTKLSRRQKRQTQKTSDVEVYVGAGPLPHAHIEEFGSIHEAPHPFLRPAIDANGTRVMNSFRDDLKAEIDKAMARQARKAARLLAQKAV